ncbi:hypothetical protein Fcan01_13642 [Folsomia candida]|uniref:Uncharacterized protein n=1 Tax=Folsomia candida TaxID=158441 RepID=A0A226E5I3_FOLCA|nr:hypothetical protein Fcan01_13642 [Folsomia candida]
MTWCILSCQSPPDQDSQSMDYAMLEGFEPVRGSPWSLSRSTSLRGHRKLRNIISAFLNFPPYACPCTDSQWINIMTLSWNVFGCYLSKYVKFVMGDPITEYRNLDFLSDEDMDRVFHMSELLAVTGAFTNVIIKDTRRERYHYNILKYMTAFQLALCAYKYFFGMALSTFFPNRAL